MGGDTHFAIATGVISILSFPPVIIAAVTAFLAYTRRYRGAAEERNIFLSVVNAYEKELVLFRDDYDRVSEVSGEPPERLRLVIDSANIIQTAAEDASLRLRQELGNAGFNMNELQAPPQQRSVAWTTNSAILRDKLQERAQLTSPLTLTKMSILHAGEKVDRKRAKIMNRLGSIAPNNLLGHIQNLITASESRVLERLQELEAKWNKTTESGPA